MTTTEPRPAAPRIASSQAAIVPVLVLAATALLGWLRGRAAHPDVWPAGLAWGLVLTTAACGGGLLLYALALSPRPEKPALLGLFLQGSRFAAVLVAIGAVIEFDPEWALPFVETALIGYACGMLAEVLLLHGASGGD